MPHGFTTLGAHGNACALEGTRRLKFRFSTQWLCIFSFCNSTKTSAVLLLLLSAAVGASAATATLSRVSCAGNSYNGAASDACSVYLTAKTNSKRYVALVSNNPSVAVPASVTVRAGSMTAGFKASIAPVTTAQTAVITAQTGGITKTFAITLSPSSSGTAALNVSASSISFGGVALNTTVEQPLTLTATGSAAVTVTSASISGNGFSVLGAQLPMTLNPGQSMTIDVSFDPTISGASSGQLKIGSNAPAQTVLLSGTGTKTAVDLTWTAPSGSSDPVVGYNVYRAPSGTASFARLNTTVATQTSYTDASVAGGVSYNYYVKSVDAQGTESQPSNTTTVQVP